VTSVKASFWQFQQTLLPWGPGGEENMKHRHSSGLHQLLGAELEGAGVSISEKMF